MTTILSDYMIHEATMALLPAACIDYDTIAIEKNHKRYIRKTPHQLIKTACLEHCATYEGRREAVMHHTGFKRKVPIPINPSQNLFTFPTHSPTDFKCSWIFYHHVLTILPAPASTENVSVRTTVVFHNGQKLPLNVSHHVFEKQMERTGMCMWRFGGV